MESLRSGSRSQVEHGYGQPASQRALEEPVEQDDLLALHCGRYGFKVCQTHTEPEAPQGRLGIDADDLNFWGAAGRNHP